MSWVANLMIQADMADHGNVQSLRVAEWIRAGETGLWAKLAEVPHRWTGTVHSPRRSALPAISWPPRRTSWSTTADGSVGGPDPTDTSQWIGRTRCVRVVVTMTVSHSHVTNGAIGHE